MVNILNDLNFKRNDFIYVTIIFLFSFLLFITKFKGYKTIGVHDSDVIVYLCNSLYYSGLNANNVGDINFLNSGQLICFLTSLLFRLGFVTPTSIILVTSAFEIAGNIGFYILLRKNFNRILSFTGAVLYSSSALVLWTAYSGMLDNPAVAISIWIIIFSILAIGKNYKYYLVAIPLFALGILVRPTVGFILPVLILYYSYKHDFIKLIDNLFSDRNKFKSQIFSFINSDEFKFIILSSLIAILIMLIFVMINEYFGVHFGLFGGIESSTTKFQSIKAHDLYYNEDYLFYFKSFFQSIILDGLFKINLSYLIYSILILGFIFKGYDILKDINKYESNKQYYQTKNFSIFLKIFTIILILSSILFFKINYLYSEFMLFIAFLVMISILKSNCKIKSDYGLFIINLSWLIFYFIFISYIYMKMDRYFTPCLIPIIFFIIYSFDYLIKKCDKHIENSDRMSKIKDNKNTIVKLILIVVILILMVHAFYTIDYNYNNVYKDWYNDFQEVSNYLKDYDPAYMDKNITTDRAHRYYEWFLNRPTDYIDHIHEPLSLYDSTNSSYICLPMKEDFENYTLIYETTNSKLYKRNV